MVPPSDCATSEQFRLRELARMGGREVVQVDSAASTDRPRAKLSPEQLDGAQVVVDMLPTGATWKAIAEELSVTPDTLRRWRSNPDFQAEMLKRSRRSLREHIPTGHSALIRNVQKGDNSAIKMLFELTGEYTESKMRSLLGAWMQFLAVAGIPEVRRLLARVNAAHEDGHAPEYHRPPEDEIEDAEVVEDRGNGEGKAEAEDDWEL